MDNNYNFKINPSPLKKSDINKHKDFDALLRRMEPIQPPKEQMKVVSKRFYIWLGSIAATLLIGILVFFNFFQNEWDKDNATLTYLSSQPYVNPPIESLTQKGETVIVNANEGGVYQFPSGSRMVVPRSAFANSYGTLIEGEVEVHFKEYHDYVDFFLSGIPMEINMDGKAGVLESAGMIEVFATQDGERLSMLPEKPIDIELKSQIAFAGDKPPAFNIYYLDEVKRTWKLEGKDELEVIPVEEVNYSVKSTRVIGDPDDPDFKGEVTYDTVYFETEATLAEALEAKKNKLDRQQEIEIAKAEKAVGMPNKPIRPQKYDGNSMTMELDFKNKDLGINNYDGTIWQVLTPIDAYDNFSSTVWEEYDLEKTANGAFTLNLAKGEKTASLEVKPVLLGKDYDQALQQFETALATYQKEKAAAAEKLATKKQAIAERMAIEKEMADKSFAEKIATLKAKGYDSYATNEIVKRTVLNKFQINRFGTWNCDRPRPPYLATLDGTFQDQHFHKYQDKMVYHTDKSQNTVRRFYLKDIAKNIQFNEDSENLLWLVTEENKLAVFPPDYFNRIQQKNGEYAFEMDLNEKVIDSEADVRAILKL